MRKKVLLIILLLVGITLGFKSNPTVDAFYKDGVYVNIFGSGYVVCKDPEACNKFHTGPSCDPDKGICDASKGNSDTSKKWWVYKFECDGKDPKHECGGNGVLPAKLSQKKENGSLTVDAACGKTIQLDVFDSDCEAVGWDKCQLRDYIVYYTGDCKATPPACNTDCSTNPNICEQATDGCTACADNGNGGKTCQRPPTPACNTDCSANPNICRQATDGCTACADNGSGGKTCQRPPACNTDCTSNPNICQQTTDGCTVCTDNGSGTKSCQPPTTVTNPPAVTNPPRTTPTVNPPTATVPPPASPTPAFDENWCKCDSINVSQIIAGAPAIFTAMGKVDAPNTDKAKVRDITFRVFQGSQVVGESGPIPATKQGNSGQSVQYQSQWTWNVPTTLQKGVTYQARATIKCVSTATTLNYPFTASVLGANDEGGLFARIMNFFKGIFGNETNNQSQPTPSPVPNNASVSTEMGIAAEDGLQLGTFAPASVIEKTCNAIKFRF